MEVIKIDKDLLPIRGISVAIVGRLAEQGILTVEDLRQNTRNPTDRKLLAKKTGVNLKSLYIWAKQADLMRVNDIDAVAADLLVKSGVRNAADLAAANAQNLKQLIDISFNNDNIAYKKTISLANIEAWKKEAAGLKDEMENDPEDAPFGLLFVKNDSVSPAVKQELRDILRKDLILAEKAQAKELNKTINFASLAQPKTVEGGFFFGLSELIAEIGRGVATAQHELDKSSLAIQNYIDADEILSNYGLTATWYVLPETSFQIKADYAVVKEETEDGTVRSLSNSLRVAPVNAKYKNYFKSTSNIESELNFKIVPVPPPVRVTEPVLVPDLLDLSVEEAQELIKSSRLCVGLLELAKGEPDNGKDSQVVAQSKDAGTEAKVNDIISLAYYKKEG